MTTVPPLLTDAYIQKLAGSTDGILNSAQRLNSVVTDFHVCFRSGDLEVPGCSAFPEGANPAEHLRGHLVAAHRLLGVRMANHLEDLVDALPRGRLFVAALTSRAVIETAAAIVHLEEKIVSSLGAPDRDKAISDLLIELHRSIGGGRFDWFGEKSEANSLERLRAYADGKEPVIPTEIKAPNVLTMVSKLDRRLHETFSDLSADLSGSEMPKGGTVRAVYAMLSDFCHPATGTGIVLMGPSKQAGWVRLKSSTDEGNIRWFFYNMVMMIPSVSRIAMSALNRIVDAGVQLAGDDTQ